MTTLATLTIDLLAESAQFRSELKKANKATDDWSKKIGKTALVAAKALAAVGTAATAGLAAMYTVTAQNIDQQDKFADKIGISTDALAGLQHAGELTGVSTQTLNMGLQRMTRRVADAAQGTGEAVKALDELGLSAQQLNTMSPDEQFKAIADAMGSVGNRSDQVRLAFKLFDSEGVGLLNTLDAGAEGLNAMMLEAEQLGIAMNRVDAAKIEQANDAFYTAGLVSKGFAQSLTVELAPIVQGISSSLIDAAKDAGGLGQVAEDLVNIIIEGAGRIADRIYEISLPIAGLRAGFMELSAVAAESLSGSAAAVAKVLNATIGNVGKMIDWLLQQFAKVAALGEDLPGRAGEWSRDISEALAENGRKLSEALQFDEDKVLDGIASIRSAANDAYVDFEAMANAPLPSEQLDTFVAKWRELAQVQAEAKANSVTPDVISPAANSPQFSEKDLNDLESLRQNYMTKEQLLLEQTLKEQEILINAEMAKQISEQESQALREASWNSYYEQVGQAAESSAQKQADAQARANQQLLQMQTQMAGNAVGIIKQTTEEGSALWVASIVAQQGMLAMQALMQAEVSAAMTRAAMIIPGNPASVPAAMAMAEKIKFMGYANAAMIAAQGVAEIAGARAMGGEVRYGQTYLVGERGPELFTAGATGQITSNENLQRAMGGEAANQPIKQITFAPQIHVEAGASQEQDAQYAEEIADRAYLKVYEDIIVGGDISKALGR